MMTAQSKPAAEAEPLTGLALLRKPFEPRHISKLPKPTKQQTEEVRADFRKGIRCGQCGSWHHPEVVHLDYVGHAALTDRLLDVDPEWSWEPCALRDGLPAFDASGGLWIKLTVCGVTRLGYGHAAAKNGQGPGAREKEVIGDALRNAAMRFGAALDLWHKGDLHGEPEEAAPQTNGAEQAAIGVLRTYENDPDGFKRVWAENKDAWKNVLDGPAYTRVVGVMKEIGERFKKTATTTDDFRGRSAGSMARGNGHIPAEVLIPENEIPF